MHKGLALAFEIASKSPVTLDMLANASQMCFLTDHVGRPQKLPPPPLPAVGGAQ